MKKHLMYATLLGGALTLSLWGCKKQYKELLAAGSGQQELKALSGNGTIYAQDDEPTVLGARYGNPYLTTTMAEAKKKLERNGTYSANTFTVKTTHLYVKFTPQTEEAYDVLTADASIELYDCPMDYEKKVVGNWYQDPEVADDAPTPQYAVVPAGFRFNDAIGYKVLGELYLPEQDKELRGTTLSENAAYVRNLIEEAYNTTVDPPPLPDWNFYPDDPSGGDYSGGYALPGKIQVFDTRLNRYIPLQGVKVTARVSMFTTYKGFTDDLGDYYLDGAVTGTADYAIKFQRDGFAIKRNRLMNAYISRVNQPNHWSYGIAGDRDRMHAHMFRGAFRYYYGDIAGMPRPGRPTITLGGPIAIEVNQAIVSNNGHSVFCWGNYQGVNMAAVPTIRVARYSDDDNTVEYGSDEIFSTTIHEIAHTGHYNTLGRSLTKYVQTDLTIRESFAVGVEWLLTGMEYRERGIIATAAPDYADYGTSDYDPAISPGFPNRQAYQYWGIGNQDDADYTNLFINLIDDYNESTHNLTFWGIGVIDDRVSGYDIGDIQRQVLPHARNMNQFESWLLTISNPTSGNVSTLINQY